MAVGAGKGSHGGRHGRKGPSWQERALAQEVKGSGGIGGSGGSGGSGWILG